MAKKPVVNRKKTRPARKTTAQEAQLPLPEISAEEAVPHEEENPAIEQLVEVGRDRGYVTIDDVLAYFPEAEKDMDQLEEVYAALLSAGVTYLDEVQEADDAPDAELAEEDNAREAIDDDSALAGVDADDTVGLYLKEVGRVPLLTAAEEIKLAHRGCRCVLIYRRRWGRCPGRWCRCGGRHGALPSPDPAGGGRAW